MESIVESLQEIVFDEKMVVDSGLQLHKIHQVMSDIGFRVYITTNKE